MLSDGAKVQAELRESVLHINAGDLFTVSLIESSKFADSIKDAAKAILGREIILRVEMGITPIANSKREKLESLSAFDIIKFE